MKADSWRRLANLSWTDDKLYIASKARHAPKWVELRRLGVPIISTWIDEAGPGETQDYSELWVRIVREIQESTKLIVYSEEGESQRGALLEMGIALGAGIPVLWLGAPYSPRRGHHPLVRVISHNDVAALMVQR